MDVVKKKISEIRQDQNNPRKEIDEEEIEALAEGIKSQGLMHPIEIDETNTIIDGHRRFLACKKAGLKEIDCIIKPVSQEMNKDKHFRIKRQLQANLTGRNLKINEAREQIEMLMSVERSTQRQLARELGIDVMNINRILSIASKGSPSLIKAVESKQIEDTLVASQIASLPKETQELVTEKIIDSDYSREQAQELIRDLKQLPEDKAEEWIDKADEINESAEEIRDAMKKANIEARIAYPYDEEKANKMANSDFQKLIYKQIVDKTIYCPKHKTGKLIWSCCNKEVG